MAGGKLLGFLQSNPQLIDGAKKAVGGFLTEKGLGTANGSNQETIVLETKSKKEDTKQNTMIYVALGAVALLFLMKKK
jgi:hypothetical protein